MRRRSLLVSLVLLGVLLVGVAQAQEESESGFDFSDYHATMTRMVQLAYDVRAFGANTNGFFQEIGETEDPLYIAPLLDVGYFMFGRQSASLEVYGALSILTGQPIEIGWRGFFEWASENDVPVPPDYDRFKGLLLATFVDDAFTRFWQPGVQETAQVNLLEAVWGGVRVDGIPSLVNARQITPEAAQAEGEELTRYCRGSNCAYPADDELVFGVYLDGDARAYPLRLLNWHEMFNDVIGHTPLLDAPNGEQHCNFRAPTEFAAIARHGDEWVRVVGYSAGCPDNGWLAADALEWAASDWEAVREVLPDVANDEAALPAADGVTGSVSGRPVMLAYCTLCGSGILYDTTIEDLTYTDLDGTLVEAGDTVLEFGSTGMLMRSNKLMYDRNTDTVWNALTGEPAFGPLVSADLQLELLPVVVTDWASWLAEHPDTSVLSLQTGHVRNYTNGAAYSDYFNDPEYVMFPVFQQDESRAENKDMVFGLRLDGVRIAYPLDVLIEEGVTNDVVGETPVVIVTRATPERTFFEPGGAAVRAYASEGRVFSPGETAAEVLADDGSVWQVTEEALIGPDGQELARLPGHLAFWFGWYGFYPDTLFYGEEQ